MPGLVRDEGIAATEVLVLVRWKDLVMWMNVQVDPLADCAQLVKDYEVATGNVEWKPLESWPTARPSTILQRRTAEPRTVQSTTHWQHQRSQTHHQSTQHQQPQTVHALGFADVHDEGLL